jgi:phosphohistidine phosphatase
MKTLYILRHGIAQPHGTAGIADDARRLTPEGLARTEEVARGFRRLDAKLDRIISSPLPRARETAEIFADVLGMADFLENADALRPASGAIAIRSWLSGRTEDHLMIVGHNPSLSDLVGLLITDSPDAATIELRKAGIAALSVGPDDAMRLDWLARPQLFRRLIGS